jgi:hypothetical protein
MTNTLDTSTDDKHACLVSGIGALVGIVVGISCATAGFAIELRRRKLRGLPTDPRSILGAERGFWRHDSVERQLLTEAAALSFVVAGGGVLVYGFAAALWDLPDPRIYVLGGLTGAIFGAASAFVARHHRPT